MNRILASIALLLTAVTLSGQEAPKNDWSIQVYRFPNPELLGGFISRESGLLKSPTLPPLNADAEAIAAYLKRSHFVFAANLMPEGIVLPPGSLAAFDPANKTLAIRTTRQAHERIASLATRIERNRSKSVNFSLQILESDSKAVRDAVKLASAKADHTAALKSLEVKSVSIAHLRLETKSGTRATVESGEQRLFISEMSLDDDNRSSTAMEERRAGTRFEVEPTIGPDGETIDLVVNMEHHHGPPQDHWDAINTAGEKVIESPLTDFKVANITSGLTMLSGMTKLLGIWKPEGEKDAAAGERLQVAFLRAHIVTLLPALDNRVEQLLRTHGDKVEKTPTAPPAEPVGATKGIITRTFQVSEDVLTMDDVPASAAGGAPAADPFAAAPPNESRMMVRITAMEILKSKGIPFPEGSSATYTASTAELLVRNTAANMKLIESFIDSRKQHAARTITATWHVIEGDAATIRKLEQETAAITDHSVAWLAVEQAVAANQIKILRSVFVEGKGGNRSAFTTGREFLYTTGTDASVTQSTSSATPSKEPDAKAAPNSHIHVNVTTGGPVIYSSSADMRQVGIQVEMEGVIGYEDPSAIDLNYSIGYDYAPPTATTTQAPADQKVIRPLDRRVKFHQAKVSTSTSIASGAPRLIGTWKPEGTADFAAGDKLQAAFLLMHIVPVER